MQHQVDDSKYIFISGALSLLIFFLFVGSFFYVLFMPNITKTYGMKKEKFVSVSLLEIPKPKVHKTQKKQIKEIKEKVVPQKKRTQPKPKKQQIDALKQNVDVDSLFSSVWTKKVNTKTKKRKNKEIKRIQEIDKKLSSIVSDLDKKLLDTKQTTQKAHTKSQQASSTGDEVNKYLAKIHAIVYDHFYPPSNSQGHTIKAVIELSPLGKVLDFRILNYSTNQALNKEADRIFQRLKNVIFPVNPKNEQTRVIIVLKPEQKE